ncbi:MAG TPA: ATP-binding protein [Candidatus Binatia bacterium]|nr:ATP-binding protein [Candidatus Binatia bacterium]
MSDATYFAIAAAMCLVPALVWGILAAEYARFMGFFRSRPVLRRLAVIGFLATTLVTVNLVVAVLRLLLPVGLRTQPNIIRDSLRTLDDTTIMLLLPLFRHGARYASVRSAPPTRAWLVANYGACGVATAVSLLAALGAVPVVAMPAVLVLLGSYVIGMLVLIARSLAQQARPGGWRAGGLGEPRTLDAVMIICGVLGNVVACAVAFRYGRPALPIVVGSASATLTVAALQSASALAFAMPLAVRLPATVLQRLVMTATAIAGTAVLYGGADVLTARVSDTETRRLIDLAAITAIIVTLVPLRAWLGRAIERVLFHRTRQRRAELQEALQGLSPELGRLECCRNAVAAFTRILHLRGAAILLASGETVVHGDLAVEVLEAVWPRGAAMEKLPARMFVSDELRDAPALGEALVTADVFGVVPIRSTRQSWGHLFARTMIFTALPFHVEDVELLESFAAQLARVLDGAALLARAVAVERSLAHAEKLAAIGELAARIAHDLRNPVTAARSLAQQLMGQPSAPFAAEHALILGELERVERRIAGLLRFARREEFDYGPVDLVELVQGTATALAARLVADGIVLSVDAKIGVTVRADREKIRHVLLNLIENAADALHETAGERRIEIAIGRADGMATVLIRDSGAGVPADALPRLFEPFFSLKPTGTGLGLPIARRTVEAHGGRIDARCALGGGMAVDFALPLASEEALPS